MGKFKLFIIGIVIVAIIAVGTYVFLQGMGLGAPSAAQEAEDFRQATEFLQNKKPDQALAIIQKYEKRIAQSSKGSQDWIALFIEAHEQTNDIAKLIILFKHFPDSFRDNEDASQMVANFFVAARSPGDFDRVRELWRGRETQTAEWFNLDLDKMVMEGKRAEALKMAESTQFEAKEDVGRLLRLALLYVGTDAKKAWEVLTKAHQVAPKDAAVRSFRAKLLEALGETDLAKLEYLGAARTEPENLYLRDQLAEFFRRQGQFAEALTVWTFSLKEPSLDLIWLKALFWQSVSRPVNYTVFEENTPPEGEMAPFIKYLMNLPQGVYWDQQAFDKLEDAGKLLQRQQMTFWLRLLQALKTGKEQEALSLIEFNRFTPLSWNLDLEIALKRILLYRMSGRFALKQEDLVSQIEQQKSKRPQDKKERPPLFVELDKVVEARKTDINAPVPPELHLLMMSDEAFAAAFLAAGWLEAGLQLHKMSVIPSTFPDWVGFAIAQALRYNRGPLPALEFVTKQPVTPAIELITAEMLVASGSEAAGLQKLEELAKGDNQIAKQAAWKLALVFITKENFDKAKQVISLQPEFAQSVAGQELLGRIAYMQGDMGTAARIYSAIEKQSTEAKSFFARQAFQDKNWKRARELTEELLRLHPNSLPLRVNLQRIIEMQEQESQAQNVPQGSKTK